MSYQPNGPVPWPLAPDWSAGVRESLGWLTEILAAKITAYTQHRSLRLSPRRTFTFDVIADGQGRRVVDALLFDQGARLWDLPIWPDVQRLGVAVQADDPVIPCRTSGFDFVAGGRALLRRDVNAFEVVTIDAVLGNGLTLQTPLQSTWAPGTRIFPLRLARVVDGSQENGWNDDAGKRSVSFELAEVCDWAAAFPASEYLGMPVLEHRPDLGTDPRASYSRQIEVVDGGTSLPAVFDLVGRSFRSVSHRWLMHGRDEHQTVRSLLYALAGRYSPIWLPSWNSDLKVTASISAAGISLTVQWCGYTIFGRQQPARRDIRIELKGGVVFYRRIVGSVDNGATEVLTIDSALGVDVVPAQIRLVSFMTLCTLASDNVDIDHQTDADGIGVCSLSFMEVADGI
jgi:hypothetical protein